MGVAGVEVNSTTYIPQREMHLTDHQYRGDSMRAMHVGKLEEEIEKVTEWEIHLMEDETPDTERSGNMMVASSNPSQLEVEWANHRMMALRDDVEKEISDLQVMLAQPTWTCPSVCKTEPEYVEGIEGILEQLEHPLRVVYNVDPSEARANLEAWREALTKELGVVSKGLRLQ